METSKGKKYNFVILTPGFPFGESDTTCLPAIQQFVSCLKSDFDTVEIIIISFQYPFFVSTYYWNGIKVIALGGSNKKGLSRILIWLKCLFKLFELHKSIKINGILSLFLTECSLVGKIFSKIFRIKHYTWLIGQETNSNNKYIKRIRPKQNELIAMSNSQNDNLYKSFGIKANYVIENGINEIIFDKINNGIRAIDVVGAGALIPSKRYDVFLEVIYQLKQQGLVNIRSVICGEGELMSDLKFLAIKLGIDKNVTFMGLTSHQETLALMNNAKIFLHPSIAEASSTVLMEALYNGCQTVASVEIGKKIVNQFYKRESNKEMVNIVYELLSDSNLKNERIVYNSMHESVKEMMQLFFTK